VLTEARVRNARTRDRPYKIFDERGLFLLVTPAGGRLWRFRYRLGTQEKLISLGAYPEVPLRRAREKREEARELVAEALDPSAERQAKRALRLNTFEDVASEWLELQTKSLAPETISILAARLRSSLFPYLGGRPVSAITAQELSSWIIQDGNYADFKTSDTASFALEFSFPANL